ncbi:MAG: hypothetical protein ABEH64_00480 [Salinirussus sp.]
MADADVLAADLFCDGQARAALDCVREHSWLRLIASEQLLADAKAVIEDLADRALAADWHDRISDEIRLVDHAPQDHPAVASAAAAGAAHVLTLEESLAGAGANLSLQSQLRVSIRTPAAFVASFDAASLYEATHEDAYPGPDADPRG